MLMGKSIFIFTPGILSYPGSARAWTDQAVTWIHAHRPNACAEKFEYLAGPATRTILATKRAKALAALIDEYPVEQFSLTIAAHSNGCEIVRRASKFTTRPINFLHLFAPAISAAPRRHGLRNAVSSGKVGFLFLHIASHDRVLSKSYLGGLRTADVQKQFADERHTTIIPKRGGHSTWFFPEHFEPTMQMITEGKMQ